MLLLTICSKMRGYGSQIAHHALDQHTFLAFSITAFFLHDKLSSWISDTEAKELDLVELLRLGSRKNFQVNIFLLTACALFWVT